jgi:DNA modification methylase
MGSAAAATRCWLPLRGEDYGLLHGDFRKIGYGVPSGSVDLILTDAPYESKYLDLFEPLSLLASQVLRQGGSRVGIDLDQRSALLLRLPCAIRRFLLAL